MNMGVMTRFLYDCYVHPDSAGCSGIDYHPSEGEVLKEHERMSATYPLEIREGSAPAIYLLVPVHKRKPVTGRGCWLLRLIEKGMVWAWLFLI